MAAAVTAAARLPRRGARPVGRRRWGDDVPVRGAPVLSAGLGVRLAGALALTALVWLGVAWALA